jgi:hypothetical protein
MSRNLLFFVKEFVNCQKMFDLALMLGGNMHLENRLNLTPMTLAAYLAKKEVSTRLLASIGALGEGWPPEAGPKWAEFCELPRKFAEDLKKYGILGKNYNFFESPALNTVILPYFHMRICDLPQIWA